jgi:hypothetical protein
MVSRICIFIHAVATSDEYFPAGTGTGSLFTHEVTVMHREIRRNPGMMFFFM